LDIGQEIAAKLEEQLSQLDEADELQRAEDALSGALASTGEDFTLQKVRRGLRRARRSSRGI